MYQQSKTDYCADCAEFLTWTVRNNEVSFTGTFGEQGVKYTLTVARGDQQALSRQVVKSDNAVVTVPELEFEIPATTQKGSITTVEGLLMDAASNIKLLQEERRAADPTTAKLIDDFLCKLDMCQQGEKDFTLLVDDPAGNSFVESPGGNPRQDAILQASNRRYAGSAVPALLFYLICTFAACRDVHFTLQPLWVSLELPATPHNSNSKYCSNCKHTWVTASSIKTICLSAAGQTSGAPMYTAQ